MADKDPEHPDHYQYPGIMFPSSGIEFYLGALRFYQLLLEADVEALQAEEDLAAALDLDKRETLGVFQELDKVKRMAEWLAPEGGARKNGFGLVPMRVSHSFLRYLKSAGILYLKKLRQDRERIASRPNVSKYTVEDIDRRLASLEENYQAGVFTKVTPMPFLIDDFCSGLPASSQDSARAIPLNTATPRPRVIESIEILDQQLRERCMDLFVKFQEEGQNERLDTVVTEATRVLEDRLRIRSGAPKGKSGVDLVTFAFSPKAAKLVVSELDAEQEAAHLLVRGVFGFVRNHFHHNLVGDFNPERALQIVGMVDYLLFVVEAAQVVDQLEHSTKEKIGETDVVKD